MSACHLAEELLAGRAGAQEVLGAVGRSAREGLLLLRMQEGPGRILVPKLPSHCRRPRQPQLLLAKSPQAFHGLLHWQPPT